MTTCQLGRPTKQREAGLPAPPPPWRVLKLKLAPPDFAPCHLDWDNQVQHMDVCEQLQGATGREADTKRPPTASCGLYCVMCLCVVHHGLYCLMRLCVVHHSLYCVMHLCVMHRGRRIALYGKIYSVI